MDLLGLLERIESVGRDRDGDFACSECGYDTPTHGPDCQLKAIIEALRSGRLVVVEMEYVDAVDELLEVASLRGDNDLPHPADDPKLWTARMQDAWDDLAEKHEKRRSGNE